MPAKFSYDKAIVEIESIIEEIELEGLSVDELSEKVKKASELIKRCKQKLTDTRTEVDNLLENLN
ncbi:MAG: exodeoxyribonuclease VII small subunit [Salinivirgaceae bacterium]|nr:exodeoxyribonuclease VII small subunit [Salinivirgaceae bacterium]